MSDHATVNKEAKSLHQGLKDLMQKQKCDPWDKDLDFQRKSLRQRYLSLILSFPYAKESKDIDHLWMQTSYALIALYKQRIAALDHILQRPQPPRPGPGAHGPVEQRKLMQRFRQFLADEDRFWTQLVVRMRRAFVLDEAQSALAALGIAAPPDASPIASVAAAGRTRFQFPAEDSVPPSGPGEHEGRLAMLSKALICLGDIARYKELYSEKDGRPKAGHEDHTPPPRGGRGKRGGGPAAVAPRPRNYERASLIYEQARALVPHDGNPSHQLAILASYQKDTFASLGHYYRALCVRQPYDTAAENMATMLGKALDQWRARMRRERDSPVAADAAPRARVDLFKERTVALHALWRLGVEKMDKVSPDHAQIVVDEFRALVSERNLPADLITKTIVIAQGALWKHRMLRDPAPPVSGRKPPAAPASADAAAVEARMRANVLALHRALLAIGLVELAEPLPRDAAADDLAQHITAAFRRTLPALRVASKWLRANFKYVAQAPGAGEAVAEFWATFARFAVVLGRTFPAARLPKLGTLLEEDIEMRGFLPLKRLMGEAPGEAPADGAGAAAEQVHPNVEQLMRIADLLEDANALAALEGSPIAAHSDQIAGKNLEVERPLLATAVGAFSVPGQVLDAQRDDDAMTETTTDDPVGDAFRQAPLDDENDEIVWDPRASISPPVPSPPSRASPLTPVRPPTQSPIAPPARSPPNRVLATPRLAPVSATTAQDLLNTVLARPRAPPAPVSSAPQPQLLFGSGPPNAPGHSIWSTSLDGQPLTFSSPRTPAAPLPPPLALADPAWAAPYYAHGAPSPTFAPPFAPPYSPAPPMYHQRGASVSLAPGPGPSLASRAPALSPLGYPAFAPPATGMFARAPGAHAHARHLSLRDAPAPPFAAPALPQVWGALG